MNCENTTFPIVGLIATRPCINLLLSRSLPSIFSQSRTLAALVIVSDSRELTAAEINCIYKLLPNTPVITLHNQCLRGAAGSWNTGLNWIHCNYSESYVAILDDDDSWDENHLETCWRSAQQHNWTDVVISGLRLMKNRSVLNHSPALKVTLADFLTGNPGWQGSNTFVKSSKIKNVGGFTAGLASCIDRDLAIRLLEQPNTTIAYTGEFTSTWYCEERSEALSAPGSISKLDGLAHFLMLHQHRMSSSQKQSFFKRAEKLFHFTQVQIIRRMSAKAIQRKAINGLPASCSAPNQGDTTAP